MTFLVQVFFAALEKFKDRNRLKILSLMIVALGSPVIIHLVIVLFNKPESDSLFVAERVSSAKCTSRLLFWDNQEFNYFSVCFGVVEVSGNYFIKNDTIYFDNIQKSRHAGDFYQFALIRNLGHTGGKYSEELMLFKSATDTNYLQLFISKNEIAN